ncbi:hypothetical protein [Myroides odoratus]|uniref:hypothetical protein n=1 Tax=Myroides odoratus TaxID=256 RepID=UPI0039AFA6E0
MRVVVLLVVLLGLTVQSCGSRKVERHSKSSLEESWASLQEQKTVTEIYFDRKKVFEIMRELNIRNGSITFNTDGSITAKGDEIGLSDKEAGEQIESTKVKEENSQAVFGQNEKKIEEEDGKKVERKQFSWWWIIMLLTIIFGVIYLIKKLGLVSSKKWAVFFR